MQFWLLACPYLLPFYTSFGMPPKLHMFEGFIPQEITAYSEILSYLELIQFREITVNISTCCHQPVAFKVWLCQRVTVPHERNGLPGS